MRLYFAALTTMVLIANSANAAERVGIPRVVDGDTLTIGAAKIRLQRIDAPETDRSASTAVVSRGHVVSKRAIGFLPISQVEKLAALRLSLTSTDENSVSAAPPVRI
jgi:endonuclease YncB( thermonuclease family)